MVPDDPVPFPLCGDRGVAQRMAAACGGGFVLAFSCAVDPGLYQVCPGLVAGVPVIVDIGFSSRKEIAEIWAIAVAPDIFRKIRVKGPGRSLHRYRILPETIEAVKENIHQYLFSVESFQSMICEPCRLSV